jgi:hypothetical protein
MKRNLGSSIVGFVNLTTIIINNVPLRGKRAEKRYSVKQANSKFAQAAVESLTIALNHVLEKFYRQTAKTARGKSIGGHSVPEEKLTVTRMLEIRTTTNQTSIHMLIRK